MNFKTILYSLLLWLALFSVITLVQMDAHEKVHQSIYKKFGINSTTNIDLLLGGTTHATSDYPNDPGKINKIESLQEQNEIYGYNLVGVELLLGAILLFMILIFIQRESGTD